MQDRWRRKFDDVTLKWKIGQNKSVLNHFFITSFIKGNLFNATKKLETVLLITKK